MRPGDALLRFAEASATDLGTLLALAAGSVNHALFAQLIESGHTVRPAHVPVFAGLDPDGTSISTIASRAGISRQAMSALVRDLESEGYVRTSADPSDRRAILVELTDRGAQFCDDAATLAAANSTAWRERLGETQYATLLDELRQLGGR